jgi:hypothetical protein
VADLDLADWLTRQYDAEEAAIKRLSAIDRGDWHVLEWYDGEFEKDGLTRRVDLHSRAGSITANGALPRPVAEHIARWDPARVLAEIAAKRRILARHAEYDFPYNPDDGPGDYAWTPRCDKCFEPWPCPDLLDLAAPCAGRPGWRDGWAIA